MAQEDVENQLAPLVSAALQGNETETDGSESVVQDYQSIAKRSVGDYDGSREVLGAYLDQSLRGILVLYKIKSAVW